MEVFVKVGGAGTSTEEEDGLPQAPPIGASTVAGREAEAAGLDAGSGDTVGGGTFEN